jgi:hypothetical protein
MSERTTALPSSCHPGHWVNSVGLLALLVASVLCGCAAVKATQQPPKRNMTVLDRGSQRTHVIAELGAPVFSEKRGDETVDVFTFKQGYTKTTKAARALVHGAADVATFGLWEVVGLPAETIADGSDVQIEVHYDTEQTVDRVEIIKGEKAVHPPKLFANTHRKTHELPAHMAVRKGKGKSAPPAAAPNETLEGQVEMAAACDESTTQ